MLLHSFFNRQWINEDTLKRFRNSLRHKLSKETQKKVLRILRSFFTWLRSNKVISTIPMFPSIKGSDAKKKKTFPYTEQKDRLTRFPTEHRDIIGFGVETGSRIAELCVLKIKDIDLQAKEVTVRRTYSHNVIRETTKTSDDVTIPLSLVAAEIATSNMRDKLPEGYLFINPNTGKNYRPQILRKLWKKYSGSSSTLYEFFRHSIATQAAARGLSEFQLMVILGQKDSRSSRHYIRMASNMVQGFMDSRTDNIVDFKTKQNEVQHTKPLKK